MLGGLRRRLAENRTLAWVCLVIAVNQLGFGIIVPVTPIYARTFGVGEAAIGLVVAVYGLGRFLFSVPVGQAADRFGRKRTIFAGTLLTCVGSLLCAWPATSPSCCSSASWPGSAPPPSSPAPRSSSRTWPRPRTGGG